MSKLRSFFKSFLDWLLCRCPVCGTVLTVSPIDLLFGCWCSKCYPDMFPRTTEKMLKIEQFLTVFARVTVLLLFVLGFMALLVSTFLR